MRKAHFDDFSFSEHSADCSPREAVHKKLPPGFQSFTFRRLLFKNERVFTVHTLSGRRFNRHQSSRLFWLHFRLFLGIFSGRICLNILFKPQEIPHFYAEKLIVQTSVHLKCTKEISDLIDRLLPCFSTIYRLKLFPKAFDGTQM